MQQTQERQAEAPAAMKIATPFSAGLEEIQRLRALAQTRRAASLEAFRRRLREGAPVRHQSRTRGQAAQIAGPP